MSVTSTTPGGSGSTGVNAANQQFTNSLVAMIVAMIVALVAIMKA